MMRIPVRNYTEEKSPNLVKTTEQYVHKNSF